MPRAIPGIGRSLALPKGFAQDQRTTSPDPCGAAHRGRVRLRCAVEARGLIYDVAPPAGLRVVPPSGVRRR
jgi:hypothetical protein